MINQHKTIRNNIEKYNRSGLLAVYLMPFIGNKKEVYIADIGSGPYSTIGNRLDGVTIHLFLIDSQDFSKFWEKQGVKPYYRINNQDMEDLKLLDNYVDIVHCANALDHTKDAEKAVQEMIRICKPRGYVYIKCNLDQMETGHKHYWNAKEDGTFVGKDKSFNLKDYGFTIEFVDKGGERRYNEIIAVLQK